MATHEPDYRVFLFLHSLQKKLVGGIAINQWFLLTLWPFLERLVRA